MCFVVEVELGQVVQCQVGQCQYLVGVLGVVCGEGVDDGCDLYGEVVEVVE